ncbi:unnamed protein product, partial [Symbiodinium sp. KB8]
MSWVLYHRRSLSDGSMVMVSMARSMNSLVLWVPPFQWGIHASGMSSGGITMMVLMGPYACEDGAGDGFAHAGSAKTLHGFARADDGGADAGFAHVEDAGGDDGFPHAADGGFCHAQDADAAADGFPHDAAADGFAHDAGADGFPHDGAADGFAHDGAAHGFSDGDNAAVDEFAHADDAAADDGGAHASDGDGSPSANHSDGFINPARCRSPRMGWTAINWMSTQWFQYWPGLMLHHVSNAWSMKLLNLMPPGCQYGSQDSGMSRGGPPWSMVELAGPPMDVDELSGPGMELDGAGNANADVSDDAGAAGGNDDGWDGAVCGGMRSA